MRAFLITLITCLAIGNLFANGKKQPPIAITFHMEASDLQSKKLTMEVQTPKGKRFIDRSPFLTTKDVEAYHSFPSPHNPDLFGVTLKLNRDGATRLKSYSARHKGEWILASINGKVVDMLYIDSEVDGRLITVWRGVDPEIIKLCDQLVPRIGEDEKVWKQRLKEEKKKAKKK